MKWDPEKYVQFADHRDRPFFDLTSRIAEANPRLVVDLGCGPGPLTRSLAERWPEARIVGLDSSAEMVGKARSAQHAPNLEFELADASSWMPDPDTDVLVSNAMLQWIPGHRKLMATWLGVLPALGTSGTAVGAKRVIVVPGCGSSGARVVCSPLGRE